MNTKDMTKEQERTELHRAIWQIANDLRGSVDGWDFKQYVLGMLFYRFISENLTNYINADERRTGNKDFDYANLPDDKAELGRADTVKEKGFYILPSELFVNVCNKASKDADLNETLASVFRGIENSAKGTNSEDDLRGLFADLDVNSNKLGNTVEQRNKKLTKIIEAIGNLKLGNYSDNTIDAFGDAYEFLMTMYASNAGKSGGEFYTPQEVSELLAEITTVGKKEVNKVYDPACGSGSLLLKFAKVLGKENVRLGFFGQEINLTTYNLCRINMFLHDINYNNFDIALGDTLTNPKHWDDEPFDAIVSNPPYSIKWEGDANPLLINDPRFSPAGVLAPKKYADLAFTMHMLSWLSTSGTAAIVEFPGVLYRSGAEKKIRKYLVENNYIDTVIQLPPDLFFGTTIATCVIVLKKSKTDNKVLFIDASSMFVRNGSKSKLSKLDREKILDAYITRKNVDYFTRLVDNKEISENEFNIAVSNYVEVEDTSEIIDIKKLNTDIENIVVKQNELRNAISEVVEDYKKRLIETDNVGTTWKTIGEIAEYRRGSFPQPYGEARWYGGDNAAPFVQVADVDENMRLVEDTKRKISKLAQPKSVFVPAGTVIVTLQGTIGRVAITQYDSYVDRTLAIFERFKIDINKRYFAYQLQNKFAIEKESARGSTIKTITKEEFTKFKIPIPSLAEQKRIVTILDRFDSLVNDNSNGLLAELEARGKQYEYYRNKLLTFKEHEN